MNNDNGLSRPVNYYFNSYLKSKQNILHENNKIKTDTKKFKNSIKIVIHSLENYRFITARDIFENLKQHIGKQDLKYIKTIMQFRSNKIWIIAFEEAFSCSSLLGKSISILGCQGKIEDANSIETREVFLTGVLRVHWLPLLLDQIEISKFLKSQIPLEIICLEKEKCKEEGMEFIENGIVRIKIKYKLEDHEKLLKDIIGIQNVANNKVLIQLNGHPPKCLRCSSFGHLSFNCVKKSERCSKCNKSGHNSDECNIAKSLFSMANQDIDKEVEEYQATACIDETAQCNNFSFKSNRSTNVLSVDKNENNDKKSDSKLKTNNEKEKSLILVDYFDGEAVDSLHTAEDSLQTVNNNKRLHSSSSNSGLTRKHLSKKNGIDRVQTQEVESIMNLDTNTSKYNELNSSNEAEELDISDGAKKLDEYFNNK